MLTDAQRTEFEQDGLVGIRGAIPREEAEKMADKIWDYLTKRHQIRRDAPETWSLGRPAHFQSLAKADAFAAMGSKTVRGVADDLLGKGAWEAPRYWGGPLVTFPGGQRRWDVPYQAWHMDLPARTSLPLLPCIRFLGLLCRIRPEGGGTLVLGASHRLVRHFTGRGDIADGDPSADVRKKLMRCDGWLRSLCTADQDGDRVRRFMKEGATIGGIETRVIEMTGEPGDVFVMHPWLLHAAAPNCRPTPRMMLTQPINRLYRTRA